MYFALLVTHKDPTYCANFSSLILQQMVPGVDQLNCGVRLLKHEVKEIMVATNCFAKVAMVT